MEPDFSGYATRNGLKCSDGRTIMPDAFAHQDTSRVPLVWQHGHNDPENVLGHGILENRKDGVYVYGFFNSGQKAEVSKGLVQHGDITSLSIWANQLVERGGNVYHGAIREVSLVLSGANPGAKIDPVSIRHGDGTDTELDDEAIIYTGLSLEHSDGTSDEDDTDDEDNAVEHGADSTIQEIYDAMSDEQQAVLHFMVGQAISDSTATDPNAAAQSGTNPEGITKVNVFDKENEAGAKKKSGHLSHDDIQLIVADAAKTGSLKAAVESYALSHGIEDIELLFPDAQTLDNMPEWIKRRTEWVGAFMGAARKSPFSRIKTQSADLTYDDARAKGYIKGTLKKEEFFGIKGRVTTPTTVYKKQKLDRDDIVDITGMDVVAWLKSEMRMMLDEEIARAALVGDGRASDDEDKIRDGSVSGVGIRPIALDDEFYTSTIYCNIGDGSLNSTSNQMSEVSDQFIMNRAKLKGTGTPNLYTTETWIAMWMTMRDNQGHRMYRSLDELASELRVAAIIPVEILDDDPSIIGIVVNPVDYVFGADKGGAIAMFDDFDIDYNQYKYLIETRLSGALVKAKSAMVIRATESTNILVSPTKPTFNKVTGVLSLVDQTGVVYKRGAVIITAASSPFDAIDAGTSITITATPATGYYFASSDDDTWEFTRNA